MTAHFCRGVSGVHRPGVVSEPEPAEPGDVAVRPAGRHLEHAWRRGSVRLVGRGNDRRRHIANEVETRIVRATHPTATAGRRTAMPPKYQDAAPTTTADGRAARLRCFGGAMPTASRDRETERGHCQASAGTRQGGGTYNRRLYRFLGNACVKIWSHYNALLLVWIRACADENRWRFTTVDCHVWDAGWHVNVITRARDLPVLQLSTGPKLHLVAAHQVERGFVVLMDVRLCPSAARREGHGTEPQSLRTDTFGADSRGVIGPLLALVGLTGSYHESGVMPGRVHTSKLSASRRRRVRAARRLRSPRPAIVSVAPAA
jgi:hypothetical protein